MPRMYSSIGGGGGVNTITVATFADLPIPGEDNQFAWVEDDSTLYFWNGTMWVLVGGQGNLLGHADSFPIPNATQTFTVTFPAAMPSVNYSLTFDITNLVDVDPIFLNVVGITKTVNDFSVTMNAPTDSANYNLEWKVSRDV